MTTKVGALLEEISASFVAYDLLHEAKLLPKNAVRKFWVVAFKLHMKADDSGQAKSIVVEADNDRDAARFLEDNYFNIEPAMVQFMRIPADHTAIKVTDVSLRSRIVIADARTATLGEIKSNMPLLASDTMRMQRNLKKRRDLNPAEPSKVLVLKDETETEDTYSLATVAVYDLGRYIDDDYTIYGLDALRQPLYSFQ